MLKRWVLISVLGSFFLSGCNMFEASTEDINKYVKDFVTIVDNAEKEEVNGQKVLTEVRQKFEHEDLKNTKVQNVILDGMEITKSIKEDVIKANLPKEMEPIREKMIVAMEKRNEAYTTLFRYYDLMNEKDKDTGEKLLKDSLSMFDDVKNEVNSFRQ